MLLLTTAFKLSIQENDINELTAINHLYNQTLKSNLDFILNDRFNLLPSDRPPWTFSTPTSPLPSHCPPLRPKAESKAILFHYLLPVSSPPNPTLQLVHGVSKSISCHCLTSCHVLVPRPVCEQVGKELSIKPFSFLSELLPWKNRDQTSSVWTSHCQDKTSKSFLWLFSWTSWTLLLPMHSQRIPIWPLPPQLLLRGCQAKIPRHPKTYLRK